MKIIDKYAPRGHFKIEKIYPNGEKILHYEEKNQIMTKFAEFLSNTVSKRKNEYNNVLTTSDMEIITFAIGTDGILSNGAPKTINPDRNRLFAEQNFWTLPKNHNNDDMKQYVYQVTFEQNNHDVGIWNDLDTQNEGATFPIDSNNNPLYYRRVYNGTEDVKLSGRSRYENNTISFEFTLGQFVGNGCNEWTIAPTFSEAALYMRRGANSSGSSLGSILAMKTFPSLVKTDTCIIRITWTLDFNVMTN